MPLENMSPDEVLALCFDEPAAADDLAAWCGGHVERSTGADGTEHVVVVVPTDKGPRPVGLGEWIVKGPDDAFAPRTAEDFVARFTPADE